MMKYLLFEVLLFSCHESFRTYPHKSVFQGLLTEAIETVLLNRLRPFSFRPPYSSHVTLFGSVWDF